MTFVKRLKSVQNAFFNGLITAKNVNESLMWPKMIFAFVNINYFIVIK